MVLGLWRRRKKKQIDIYDNQERISHSHKPVGQGKGEEIDGM
jgi:uncharacterized Fe-S cluster protein YjdI